MLTGADRARAAMTAGLEAMATAGSDREQKLRAYADALEVAHVPRFEDVRQPDGRHCRQPNCYCTHTAPCDAGWMTDHPAEHKGRTYDRVVPCPQCRPDAYAKYVVHIEATSHTVRN